MANKWQIIGLALVITVAFFAGGWFFSHTAKHDIKQEIEGLYQKDGSAVGICDEKDAYCIKSYEEQEGEDISVKDGQNLPSQVQVVPLKDIAGVAPKKSSPVFEEKEPAVQPLPTRPVVQLNGDEKTTLVVQAVPETEDSHITMIVAPVRLLVVRNLDEYKAFKQRAQGGYPTVDFAKQMVIVLESDSNFPDKVFEIVSAEKQDGALMVSYRVNVLGLDKKINSHAALAVDKTQLPVQLKQVL